MMFIWLIPLGLIALSLLWLLWKLGSKNRRVE
jgi:hypothetical protein